MTDWSNALRSGMTSRWDSGVMFDTRLHAEVIRGGLPESESNLVTPFVIPTI